MSVILEEQPITQFVWDDKYRWKECDGSSQENSPEDSIIRQVKGVYAKDKNKDLFKKTVEACISRRLLPAGRILAGAGTTKAVTLLNCYVSQDIPDSMRGIMDSLKDAALTQQQGGGIGMSFSSLRPNGAVVKKTGSISTGPLHFMDMWHTMCTTIKSSGARRGAMMGVMIDDHPDILDFIVAKTQAGRLTNFNVSVGIQEAFMQALEEDGSWNLGFGVEPADASKIVEILQRNGKDWWVYKKIQAAELWESIMKNTYDYAEPGVLFLDRINEWNNLYYCEKINATNPCGEQPLPAHGACDLIHNNMAAFVEHPFTNESYLDLEALKENVALAVRFADNVLDVSHFPLEPQKIEAAQKRRIGVGQAAVGNMLQMLGLRYGSPNAICMQESAAKTICLAAYRASVELSKERGPFQLYDKDKFLAGKFIQFLKKEDPELVDMIAEYGIRNGVLLSDAPVGTMSIFAGNISSGIEPTFAFEFNRKVLQQDNSFAQYRVEDYGWRVYKKVKGLPPETKPEDVQLPDYMVTATELDPYEHLEIAAVTQKWVDAAISKTINVPADYPYEAFKGIYLKAYKLGMKGCTTYRPSGVRGAVLTTTTDSHKKERAVTMMVPMTRPEVLPSTTYKIKWPHLDQAFYITISDYIDEDSGKRLPFEIFINSKSVHHQEWIVALTRMMSAVFRKGGDVTFMVDELEQVFAPQGGAWIEGEFVPSLVALIGKVVCRHLEGLGLMTCKRPREKQPPVLKEEEKRPGDPCPQCNKLSLYKQEGCAKCNLCGYSGCS